MNLAAAALTGASLAGTAALWACLRASLSHFRGAAGGPASLPMTLVKPMKGLDDGMDESFRSIVAADARKVLQVIVAVESADDPAHGVGLAFQAAHRDRDIEVLVTGPAGERMGKAHNMAEAVKAAKHDRVLFSDADARVSRELLAEAERAFRGGADAVYGLPYHVEAEGTGGWWYMIAFNHAFCVPAALMHGLGQFRSFSGGFMGYTKAALARVGGVEAHAREIADDFALGRAARAAGLRQELLREPAFVSETGTGTAEAFAHVAKWASIVFWSFPVSWLLYPLLNPVLMGLAALAAGGGAAAAAALAAALASRVAIAIVQDRRVGRYRLPAWHYWRLLLADAGSLAFFVLGFRPTIEWRGRRYRLSWGGGCRVLPVKSR